MLLDEPKPAGTLAAGDCGERLDVLPLTPRRPGRELSRQLEGGLRRCSVALEEREEGPAGVGEGDEALDG